jgi:hypothetical protein
LLLGFFGVERPSADSRDVGATIKALLSGLCGDQPFETVANDPADRTTENRRQAGHLSKTVGAVLRKRH